MDSVNAPTLQDILSVNNARMDRQDEQMLATGRAVQALVAQVSELTNQLQQLRSPAAPSPSPPPPPIPDSHNGNRTVSDYSIEFRTLAAESKWNEAAQWDMFLHGLADRIQREIFTLELPEDLDGLISLVLRVDSRLSTVAISWSFKPRCRSSLDVPSTLPAIRSARFSIMNPCRWVELGSPGRRETGEDLRTRPDSRAKITVRRLITEQTLVDDFSPAPLSCKISVNALNGQTLPSITHSTRPITMITSGNHKEELTFLLTTSPLVPVVLGHLWLVQHNPREESVNLSNMPKEYLDLKEVFSKSRAASLPPHHPYDSGLIRPSSSPAGAGFFFVKKKDGSLRPCIDYRGLNNITVKNTYPLPLMSSAFERLHRASVFTKLDLRNAYHLVRIREGDEWKTAFNTPRGHFEYLEHVQHVRRVLQRLLKNGLFVKVEKCVFHAQSVPFLGYIVSSEGICMDPDKVKAVVDWPTPVSRKALQSLIKSRFVFALILVAPDSTRQFVVEVDASEVGIGAVLSQRASSEDKMHSCTFFSHRMSAAERNYDIGNRELLAVKLALEEWRHWLEGSGGLRTTSPSAKETAATVVNHVFRIHGLPTDVDSDRGPQFISKFWREFCRLLGASVSLSSGFHPQSNGQTERANQDLERVFGFSGSFLLEPTALLV
ncbi:Transposon Tf2-6 polyprotein [Labeo rohita]|uniref:ribonuclease H n=1 Tax=Labeo rohita TaxID=84645 RepID=A0ABQ8L5I4_LABRO|nr:Transposon Tf2-6 polyprotein [Labeo rohita]